MKANVKFKKHIIKEPFASEIRKTLIRCYNKNFTKEEIELFKKHKEINNKYEAKWIDL